MTTRRTAKRHLNGRIVKFERCSKRVDGVINYCAYEYDYSCRSSVGSLWLEVGVDSQNKAM